MICKNCGANVEEGFEFCASCGAKIFRDAPINPNVQYEKPAEQPVYVQNPVVAPAEPVAQAPIQPVVEAPVQPITEVPVEPVAEIPVEPVAEVPAEPVAEQPIEHVYAEPVQPPVYTQPQQPPVQQNYYAPPQNNYQPTQQNYNHAPQYQSPVTVPAEPARRNVFSILSLVLGLVSLVLGCCPYGWYVYWILAVTAIAFAIVDRCVNKSFCGMSIIGLISGSLGLILIVVILVLVFFFGMTLGLSEM